MILEKDVYIYFYNPSKRVDTLMVVSNEISLTTQCNIMVVSFFAKLGLKKFANDVALK